MSNWILFFEDTGGQAGQDKFQRQGDAMRAARKKANETGRPVYVLQADEAKRGPKAKAAFEGKKPAPRKTGVATDWPQAPKKKSLADYLGGSKLAAMGRFLDNPSHYMVQTKGRDGHWFTWGTFAHKSNAMAQMRGLKAQGYTARVTR